MELTISTSVGSTRAVRLRVFLTGVALVTVVALSVTNGAAPSVAASADAATPVRLDGRCALAALRGSALRVCLAAGERLVVGPAVFKVVVATLIDTT